MLKLKYIHLSSLGPNHFHTGHSSVAHTLFKMENSTRSGGTSALHINNNGINNIDKRNTNITINNDYIDL